MMQAPLKQFTWRRGPDMPFGMTGYIQSVLAHDRLYVGGGNVDLHGAGDNNYCVVEYNVSSEEWTTLPQYTSCYFAMAVVCNQLVLVGGRERHRGESKVLGVWGADCKEWTHPYPDMPTARYYCSSIVWNEWLVVAGGWGKNRVSLSCVEILNTSNMQWHTGPPTPTPWACMRAAMLQGKEGYFMGGLIGNQSTNKVYHIDISSLISHVTTPTSSEKDREMWKEIHGLQLTDPTPLSIKGSLLAVGGRDAKDRKTVSTIHLYQPDNGQWIKIGDLTSPRGSCTCAATGEGEMLVAGGWDGHQQLKTVDFALIA